MSTTTSNYNLIKYELTDNVDDSIGTDQPATMDIIDNQMKTNADNISNHIASNSSHDGANITYTPGEVPGASNVSEAIDDLQTQINSITVGAGTSPAEVVAARDGVGGESNATLKTRLDKMERNVGKHTNISSNTVLTTGQRGVIRVDTTSANIQLTLPAPDSTIVMQFKIIKATSDSNIVIITSHDGSSILDGSDFVTLGQYWETITFINNGTTWDIDSKYEKGYLNIRDFGAYGDNSADDRNAINDAQTAGDNLYFPPGNYKIGTSLTLSAGKKLKFAPGAVLIRSGTATITGDDTKIEAGLTQIISEGATPLLAGTWDIKSADLKWYGAVGDDSTDDTQAVQACLNTFKNIQISDGNYKTTSVVTVSANHKIIGVNKATCKISAYGCNAFNVTGDFCEFENLIMYSYSAVGAADPKTHDGIVVAGASGSNKNYNIIKNIYFQGWRYCIDWQYTWSSEIIRCTTINCNVGIKLTGESVNNRIVNNSISSINTSGGRAIYLTQESGNRGEGLMIANNLIGSTYNGIESDSTGFLSLNVCNNVIDLCANRCVSITSVENSMFSNNWMYSTYDAIYSANVGSPQRQNITISGNSITSVSGTNGIFVGANNLGWTISGNNIRGNNVCLYLESNAVDIAVTGNYFSRSGSAGSAIFASGFEGQMINNNTGDSSIQLNSLNGRTSMFNNKGNGGIQHWGANADPASNAWSRGDIRWNITPDPGEYIGRVCTTAGTPGTWTLFGNALLVGSKTYDPPNLVNGSQTTTTVTATGAALGDIAECSFSLDQQGLVFSAYVSSSNTVTVVIRNDTGGAIDLASGTLYVNVKKLS